MAGAETFTAIAQFGKRKIDLLRRLRPYANGTPDHDRLGAVFAALDPEPFQKCFVAWVATLIGAPADVIAIDGKTSRRSYQKNRLNPIHMVSAFAARQRLVLGQVKVAQKSNEIVAIPKLLDMLAIEGATVTIDAMGCQREIAARIIARKADYVLALKGNQGTLQEDVERFAGDMSRLVARSVALDHDTTLRTGVLPTFAMRSYMMMVAARLEPTSGSAVCPAPIVVGAKWRRRRPEDQLFLRRVRVHQMRQDERAGMRAAVGLGRLHGTRRSFVGIDHTEPGIVASSVYAAGSASPITIEEAGEWSDKDGHVVWIGPL